MNLRIGILIIGSLLWDEEKGRPAWRNDRLRVDQAVAVRAPIRYGRKASGRDNTYTMVLSRKAPLGIAQVLPCRRNVTGVDLFDEAIHLWRAESGDPNSQEISANWGCVALMARDKTKFPQELFDTWAQRVSTEPKCGRILHAHDEEELVSVSGEFQITWPARVDNGAPLELDLLLATTNQPTLLGDPKDYPSARQIAAEWRRSRSNERYFHKNREYGIQTFEDDAILALLQQ